jgi:hypothetical protein
MQSKTQYSMHFTDPDGSVSMPCHISHGEDHHRIRQQRDLCASILRANRCGILHLSQREIDVVRAMRGSCNPLKDTHLAVLRALVERAGQ